MEEVAAPLAVLAVEGTAPGHNPTMSPNFWQLLLASEVAPVKADLVLRDIGESKLDAIAVLRGSPHLTSGEKERMLRADPVALERALESGARVLERKDYPETLAESGRTSPALFVRGDTDCLSNPSIAIVGTRAASTYGKAAAQKFAERLAASGITILSGGAYGIDHAAHQGALAVGGKTGAVLATGVDVAYPHQHRSLFDHIAGNGCLISQFACGVKPDRYRFLMRNELMAALADAVLVIEAPETSGALRTAGAANELNRLVFVVPANISNPNFRGSHALIRDGAMLVDHPDQILESMGIEASEEAMSSLDHLSEPQRRILAILGDDPLSSEMIVAKTDLDAGDVLGELTMLEMEGLILRDGIGYARKP